MQPLPAKQWSGRGRPTFAIRRDTAHQPISAKQLAVGLPKKAWRRVTWREGSNAKLASRFAAVRVRPAHRDYHRATPRPEEWCLIEWPADEPEPTKYWLSTLPATISRRALVNTAKLRWRIERDYQDLQESVVARRFVSIDSPLTTGLAPTISASWPAASRPSCMRLFVAGETARAGERLQEKKDSAARDGPAEPARDRYHRRAGDRQPGDTSSSSGARVARPIRRWCSSRPS